MSAYPPPDEVVAIFNTKNYRYNDDDVLTYNEAKKYFLTYPTAQGTEYFGDASIANRLSILGDIQFSDGSIQTIAYTGSSSSYIPTFYAYTTTTSANAPIAYINFSGASWGIDDFITLKVNIQVLLNNVGQAYNAFNGYIDVYPNRVPTNAGTIANINNEINGVKTFDYTDITYAPNGRYYYSHDYSLQGLNNNIYLHSTSQSQIGFYILNPNSPNPTNVSINVDIINQSSKASALTVSGLSGFDYSDNSNF